MSSLGRTIATRARRLRGDHRAAGGSPEESRGAPATGGAGQKGAGQQGAGGKTFLLGMGCQKGGTTWLSAYLAGSPQYARGYRKEYHVFDAAALESERWMRDRILRMAGEELDKARRGEPCDAEQLHRAGMYADHSFYYDYFAGLLNKRPRIRATGDLTPDYGMLPVETVREITEQFAQRRVRTVSVFLMRDPVERVWSHIRMKDQRQPHLFDVPAEEVVAEHFDQPSYDIRTQYHKTIETLTTALRPDQYWIGFYEELFAEQPVREICDLVGIDFRPPDFDERRNAYSKGGSTLPEDVLRRVARHYAPVYEGVARQFPDKDLEQVWPSSRYLT